MSSEPTTTYVLIDEWHHPICSVCLRRMGVKVNETAQNQATRCCFCGTMTRTGRFQIADPSRPIHHYDINHTVMNGEQWHNKARLNFGPDVIRPIGIDRTQYEKADNKAVKEGAWKEIVLENQRAIGAI